MKRISILVLGLLAVAGLGVLIVLAVFPRREVRRPDGPRRPPARLVPDNTGKKPPAAPDSDAEAIAKAIARLKSPDIGMKDLRKDLAALALGKDPRSIKVLLALSDGESGLLITRMAVEALGLVSAPADRPLAAAKTRAKMDDTMPQLAAAAVQSYARLKGDEGVPEVLAFIRNRWARPDGYELTTTSAGATALGEIGTPVATAALASELAQARERGWVMDYGSAVVAALGKCRTPEARAALLDYAALLASRMPGADDPNGRKYYEDKIAEARAAAAAPPPPPPLPPQPQPRPMQPIPQPAPGKQ